MAARLAAIAAATERVPTMAYETVKVDIDARGVATLSEVELAATLAEPHPSWMKAIEDEWRRRFGAGS